MKPIIKNISRENNPRFLLLAYALFFLVAGCGGGSNNSFIVVRTATPTPSPTATPATTQTPLPSPSSGKSPTATATPPPPFANGEGDLISSHLVVTYSTSTGPLALNSLYTQAICNNLSAADCTTNKNNLNTPQFGNFNVNADPIGKNPLGIGSVDAAKITYTALNVDKSILTLSGGIVIPRVAPADVKGLVVYFHETTVQRTNVPSNFLTPTNMATADTDGALLAAVWASQGYVVVMPDYIGLGDDTAHVHQSCIPSRMRRAVWRCSRPRAHTLPPPMG